LNQLFLSFLGSPNSAGSLVPYSSRFFTGLPGSLDSPDFPGSVGYPGLLIFQVSCFRFSLGSLGYPGLLVLQIFLVLLFLMVLLVLLVLLVLQIFFVLLFLMGFLVLLVLLVFLVLLVLLVI